MKVTYTQSFTQKMGTRDFMSNNQVRCFRCHGRKEIYEINGGYTMINTGGVLVKCPLCAGAGMIEAPRVPDNTKTKTKTKARKKATTKES